MIRQKSLREKWQALTIVLVGMVIIATASATWCSAKSGEEITVIDSGEPGLPETIKRFEAQSGIKVNLIEVRYADLLTKIITGCMAEVSPYDAILGFDLIWIPALGAAGLIDPLEPTKEMKEGMTPACLEAMMYKGKSYGISYEANIKYFWYNEGMLQEAGIAAPPRTWDELVEQSLKLQKQGIVKYPTIWSWLQAENLSCDFMTFFADFGGRLLMDENRNPTFNGKIGVRVLQLMSDMLNKYKIVDPASLTLDSWETYKELLAGRVAFTSHWNLETYYDSMDPAKSKVVGKVKLGLMPGSEVVRSGVVNGPAGGVIPARSRHKEAARKLIEFVASKEEVKRRYLEAGLLPSWKGIYRDPDVIAKLGDLAKVLEEQDKYAIRQSFAATWYNEFSEKLQLVIHDVLLGKKNPKQALDEAAEFFVKLRDKYETTE